MKDLVVTPHTALTLAQLRDALQDAGDGMLLAKIKPGGTVVLYERTKARKFENPAADGRRADRAIRTIEALLQGQPGFAIGDDDRKPLKNGAGTLLKYIRSLADKKNGGAIPASRLRDALPGIQVVLKNLQDAPSKGVRGFDLGIGKIEGLDEFATRIGRNEETDVELGRILGDKLKDHLQVMFLEPAMSGKERLLEQIAYSSNRFLKAQLSYELGKKYRISGAEEKLGWPDGLSERFDGIAKVAVDRLAMCLLDDQPIPGTEKVFRAHGELPHVRVNGDVYKPVRQLGQNGSFGFAMEYVHTSPFLANKRIVLKIMLETVPGEATDDAMDMAGTEALMHRAFSHGKSPNVVALKGVLRFEDGRFGIAMELAPRGNLDDVQRSVMKAVEEGKITKDEGVVISLTMLQELGQGLYHIKKQAHGAHLDLHAGNVFIGEDGTVKIGDFGLSVLLEKGQDLDWNKTPTTEQPLFMAPEIAGPYRATAYERKAKWNAIDRQEYPTVHKDEMVSARKLVSLLPSASKNVQRVLTSNLFDSLVSESSGAVYFNKSVDIWAFGAAMLMMLTGKAPCEHIKSRDARLNAIVDYATSGSAALSEPDADGNPKNGAIGVETGNHLADTLMVQLLHSDPRVRPNIGQVLRHPIWKTPGVGTPAAKSLMIAVADGDMAGILAARAGLQAQQGGVPPAQTV